MMKIINKIIDVIYGILHYPIVLIGILMGFIIAPIYHLILSFTKSFLFGLEFKQEWRTFIKTGGDFKEF